MLIRLLPAALGIPVAMSRHQAYRNYDYENDLDEYEGEDFDEEDDGMSPEDRGKQASTKYTLLSDLGHAC